MGLIKYTTRIKDFNATPRETVPGERVKISGYLQFYNWTKFPPGWEGLDGHKVKILVDNEVVREVYTAEEGFFETYHTFESVGEYVLKAVYEGTHTPVYQWEPAESREILVRIVSKEEWEKRSLYALVIGGGIMLSILGLVYLSVRRRG